MRVQLLHCAPRPEPSAAGDGSAKPLLVGSTPTQASIKIREIIMKLKHICEVCGKTEILTPEEAFDQGWDYPPRMGSFGILSPRTCGDCTIDGTLWWKMMKGKSVSEFTEDEMKTLQRIMNEPESILVEE